MYFEKKNKKVLKNIYSYSYFVYLQADSEKLYRKLK